MADTGLYCYALASELDPAAVVDQVGIGDNPLRLVDHEGLVAVVSDVDLAEFGEDALRDNLESLSWLESVATTHDQVVRLLTDRAPTAPLRLATIFVSEQGLRDRLREWGQQAREVLDRIRGAHEWSVKVYVDPVAAPEPETAPAAPEGAGAGRAYLLGRRAAVQSKDRSMEAGAEAAQAVHDRLTEEAGDSRRLAPQDRRLTGHTGEMVLNGAYLVADERSGGFQALLDQLSGELAGTVRIEAGGPWAPYSFAQLEDA